ncbi:MAG: M48 family metallopeptidase [Planctomycetes bacterium]|nr:M48 family metallopeptidase [Planctomycetota bacterium]
MKTIVSTIAALFLVLFILTTFVPYPPARSAALNAGFTDADIDTGLQLAYERRFFAWATIALELGILCAFALSGLGRRWADRLLEWTGERRIPAALGMGLTIAVVHEILWLPIGIARLNHAWAWDTYNLDFVGWLIDHAKSSALSLVMGAIAVTGLYTVLIKFPRTWWLVAAVGASVLGVAAAFLAPILINPLFNTFTPLGDTPWRDHEPRVQALIAKAQIPVQEILVVDGSRQSNHSNAYFTGFGATRRIVLYDTLFKRQYTPDEIESILAHEIGHWREDHINKGLLLGTLAAIAGFFLLDRILRFAIGRAPWRLKSIADPASLPLILLLMFLGSWVVQPVANAVSRHFERQADEVSLELAGQPKAFIDTELKLARDNKGNVAPTPWNVWLFATHPPTVERIRMAREWEKSTKGTKDTK